GGGMFGSETLEIVIGVGFVLLLLSLIATALKRIHSGAVLSARQTTAPRNPRACGDATDRGHAGATPVDPFAHRGQGVPLLHSGTHLRPGASGRGGTDDRGNRGPGRPPLANLPNARGLA